MKRLNSEIFAELLKSELKKTELQTGVIDVQTGSTGGADIILNKNVVKSKHGSIHAYVDALKVFLKDKFQIKIAHGYIDELYDKKQTVTIAVAYFAKYGVRESEEFDARILGLRWQVEPPDKTDIVWAKQKAIKTYEHSNMLTSEIQKGRYNFDSFFGLGALDGLSQQEQKAYKSLIQDFVDEIAKVRNLYAMTFGINKNSLDYREEELEKIARIVDDLADKYKSKGIKIMVVPGIESHVRVVFPNARYTFDVQHVLPQVAASMGIKKPQPNFGANAALSPETRKNLEALKKYTNNKSIGFEQAVHTIPGGYFASNSHVAVFIADESAKEYISDSPMDDRMKGNLFKVLLLHENYIGTLLNLKQLERFKGIPPTHPYDDIQKYRILINGFALYVNGVTLNLFVKSIKEFIVKRANNTPVYLYGGKDRIIATTVPPDVNLVDALKSKKYDFALMTTSIAMRKDEYITYDTISNTITTADATGIVDIYDSQFEIPAQAAKHATAKLAAVKSGLIYRKK